MANKVVKKTISLPRELAREVERRAREEHKSLSAVIQESLWTTRRRRLRKQFRDMQNYWSQRAKEKGILSETDLERYLRP